MGAPVNITDEEIRASMKAINSQVRNELDSNKWNHINWRDNTQIHAEKISLFVAIFILIAVATIPVLVHYLSEANQ
jgi:hypothetical protein